VLASTPIDINKYRDLCRKLINECTDLTPAHKLVLLKLADYVNSKDYTAWPSFTTLAADCGASLRTVVRAIDAARRLRVLKCLYLGGMTRRGGTSNRYQFYVTTQCQPDTRSADDLVPTSPRPSANQSITQCQVGTVSSNRSSKGSSHAPPSSSFGNDAVGAEEERKRAADEEATSGSPSHNPSSEIPKRWTRPIVYSERPRTAEDDYEVEEVYEPGPVPRRWFRKPSG
jgi:Helix-turn-helix domain